MSSDDPFRLVLLTILVVTSIIMIYHRLQAAKSGERISHKDEGLMFAVSLRLAGLCMWIGTLAYLMDPAWMEWASLPIPSWLRWLGAVLGVAFVGLIYWTVSRLGKNLTDTVVTRANATLVTAGPYRWVRHPFYISVGLLILAVTLLLSNWFIGLSGLLTIALLIVRTPKEEQKLIDRFGDKYRDYMAATGRFWPSVRRKQR